LFIEIPPFSSIDKKDFTVQMDLQLSKLLDLILLKLFEKDCLTTDYALNNAHAFTIQLDFITIQILLVCPF